jgi:hypothetical protein
MRFGGRERIRRGVDIPVEAQNLGAVRHWLGADHVTQMAAALFSAAAALKLSGLSLSWAIADAAELERLRGLDVMYRAWGRPVGVQVAPQSVFGPASVQQAVPVELFPRLKAISVVEYVAPSAIGDVIVERK